MAVVTPVAPGFSVANSTTTLTTGPDTIPVGTAGRYLLQLRNTTGGAITVTVDDPTTPLPGGAAANTTFADVAVSVPATTGIRYHVLDAARFRDGTGNINVTSTAGGVLADVIGPF